MREPDRGHPGRTQAPEPTTELCRVVCKNCQTEFVKNVEDDSELCYQCRIDDLLRRKKEKEAQDAAAAAAAPEQAQPATETPAGEAPAPAPAAAPAPEPDKSASRYTFRNSDGLVLGPIKLRTVAVLVREKRITGNEEISKDGGDYKPLSDFPELAEFFPDLCAKTEAVVVSDEIPLEDSQVDMPARTEEEPPAPSTSALPQTEQPVAAQPASADQPVTAEPEPKIYTLKYNGGREFGPVRKTTVLDLIECGFLKGADQVTRDKSAWQPLSNDEEFKGLKFAEPESEEADVVDLLETVE